MQSIKLHLQWVLSHLLCHLCFKRESRALKVPVRGVRDQKNVLINTNTLLWAVLIIFFFLNTVLVGNKTSSLQCYSVQLVTVRSVAC